MVDIGSDLACVFHPRSVAVVGASASFGKWGQMIFSNIVAGKFPGRIFPVNPKETSLYGLKVYSRMQDIPEEIDLAIVTTPAATVPGVLAACGEKGVKGVVLITSGFGETDQAGKRLEREIVALCRAKRIRLIGPNTMGILSPHSRLFATGTHSRPRTGEVAFVSQSGNLGNQLIHWAESQNIGISLFAGSGNEAMISCVDYLRYLEGDPRSRLITLYLENIADGRAFLETALRVNRSKPIVVLKGGRTKAGMRAAASHTGSMGGRDAIFRAVCRQAGVALVNEPLELLDLSAGFSSLPLPKGNRVGIVTLGGGWGVVTADACNERGLQVPSLPDAMVAEIGRLLPDFWSRGNPVDLVGTRDLEVPLVAVESLLKWDGVDSVISLGIVGRVEMVRLLIQSTREVDPQAQPAVLDELQAMAEAYEVEYVQRIVELMERYEKPVLGVSLARSDKGVVRSVTGGKYSGVFYQSPESAVRTLASMAAYARLLER